MRRTTTEARQRTHGRVFASFRWYPGFRLLWMSNLFFFGGVWTQTLILGWLVFDLTESEFLLALFTAVRLAPMLLGPIGGAISDRFDRARFVMGAVLWAFAAVVALAALVSTGHITYVGIVVGGLCIGLAQSPSQPARSTLALDLVGRESISNANALNSMAMSSTQILGPALGGAMISAFGVSVALWISAGWYLLSFVMLLPIRRISELPYERRGAHHESLTSFVRNGFRLVLGTPLAGAVLSVTLVANILLWPVYQTFMPVFAKDVLELDASGLGWLVTCSGLGGLAGSIAIAFLGDFRFKGTLFVFGTTVWGALWLLFGLSRSVPLSFVLMVGIGLASAAFGVLQTTLLLVLTEPVIHGRALGLQELAIGIQPLAALVLGGTAELFGVGGSTVLSGALLVAFMLVLAVRVPALRRYAG